MPHVRFEVGIITVEGVFETGVFSSGPIHPNDAIHAACADANWTGNGPRRWRTMADDGGR